MLALAPYQPSLEDLSDHLSEAVSMDIDPNSVFKLPEGTLFAAPGPDGPDQLLLVLSKWDANTNRVAHNPRNLEILIFPPSPHGFPDRYFGFVASIKERDSYNTDLGLQLTVVLKIHYQLEKGPSFPRSHVYCRVNAYSSRALLAHDFTAIRVGSAVSGLIEKSLGKPHTAQLAN